MCREHILRDQLHNMALLLNAHVPVKDKAVVLDKRVRPGGQNTGLMMIPQHLKRLTNSIIPHCVTLTLLRATPKFGTLAASPQSPEFQKVQ